MWFTTLYTAAWRVTGRGESWGKQEAIWNFLLCRCFLRGDAPSPHQAASWATAVDSCSTRTKFPGCSSPSWTMLDKDSCGAHGTWCCPSLVAWNVLHTQRQQLVDRNHAVTEAGGEFQLAESLKAKSQWEGRQRVPPRSANHLSTSSGTLCCGKDSDKALSQQWGE